MSGVVSSVIQMSQWVSFFPTSGPSKIFFHPGNVISNKTWEFHIYGEAFGSTTMDDWTAGKEEGFIRLCQSRISATGPTFRASNPAAADTTVRGRLNEQGKKRIMGPVPSARAYSYHSYFFAFARLEITGAATDGAVGYRN